MTREQFVATFEHLPKPFDRCPAGDACCPGRLPSTDGSVEFRDGMPFCRFCQKPARKER